MTEIESEQAQAYCANLPDDTPISIVGVLSPRARNRLQCYLTPDRTCTVGDVRNASNSTLHCLRGVGETTVMQIRRLFPWRPPHEQKLMRGEARGQIDFISVPGKRGEAAIRADAIIAVQSPTYDGDADSETKAVIFTSASRFETTITVERVIEIMKDALIRK